MGASHDGDFEKQVDLFYRFMLKSNPVSATFLGVHDYDHEFSDYSPSGIKGRLKKLETFKRNFKSLNKRLLKPDNKVDLDLILGRIEADLLMEKKFPPYKTLPDSYLNEILYGIYALITRDFQTDRERALSATRRLAQVPNMLRHAQKHLEKPSTVYIESAIITCKGAISFFEEFVPEFANQIYGALRDALLESNSDAIAELEKFVVFLEDEKLPGANQNFAIGKTVYNLLLRHEHRLGLSSDKLIKIANKSIKSIESELKDVAKQISKKKSWLEIANELKKKHPSAQGLVGVYKREIKRARAFVLKNDLVPIIDDDELNVIPTPYFARPLIPYSDYLPPAPLEEEHIGTFWVTTPTGLPSKEAAQRLKGHSNFGLSVKVLHESYPGHHLQQTHANRSGNMLRHLIKAPVFSEGWAFYCEEMMWEQAFYDNPRQRLLQLKDALFRAYRVLIDIGLQSKTMDISEAVKLLVDKVGVEAPNAEDEVRGYCQHPTRPMSYLIGKVQIEELLKDYRKSKGKDFSLKQFHEDLLSHGTIPISMIRTLMGL